MKRSAWESWTHFDLTAFNIQVLLSQLVATWQSWSTKQRAWESWTHFDLTAFYAFFVLTARGYVAKLEHEAERLGELAVTQQRLKESHIQ